MILPDIGDQTNTPDITSQLTETQQRLPHIGSPLAKSGLALKVPIPIRRPLSIVIALLVES